MRRFACLLLLVYGFASSSANAAACSGFGDVDTTDAYCNAVIYVKNKGITLGCGTGVNYCPNDFVTRAQMALFLERFGKGDSTNTLGDSTNVIGGGEQNMTSSIYATVGGGANNAAGQEATVSGGAANLAPATYSTVAGGFSNTASGFGSFVGGGLGNVAAGNYSFVAGLTALADNDGCFVWADSSNNNGLTCSTNNAFLARAAGGYHLYTNAAATTGVTLAAGSGSWTSLSDSAAKSHVTAVDPQTVLATIVAIPVSTWNYNAQDPAIRHMGPMAQDFFAAFGLGETDKGISTVDAQGVALAAIQGLNAKLEAKDARIVELEGRLARIEALLAR